jgi:hypothetical protein
VYAGVFGGLDSGVTEQTTRVFIESACFHPFGGVKQLDGMIEYGFFFVLSVVRSQMSSMC